MNSLINDLDNNLAILGIGFSIVITIYVVNLGLTIYAMVGLFTFLSCITWLLIRKKAILEFDSLESCSIHLALASVFFFIFTFSLLSIYFRPIQYERPLVYFILTSVMSGIVSLQILLSPIGKYTNLVLLETIIVGLSLEWTQKLIFPSLTGIDPAWHRMFTLKALSSGHIPSGYPYSYLPMMHLETLAISLVTDLPYDMSSVFSTSFSQVVLSILILYLLGTSLFDSCRIGLLGALLLSISNLHVAFGWWSTPNTFASTLMIVLVYLILKVRGDNPLNGAFLIIPVMVSLVLSHTVTSACTAIVIFIIWVASGVYRKVFDLISSHKPPLEYQTVFFFTVFMFSWWAYASGHIRSLVQLVRWGFSIDVFYRVPLSLEYYTNVPFVELLFNNLGFVLFFAISLIGCFYMISANGNMQTFSIAISGLTTLSIGFISFITEKQMLNVRWLYFSQIFLALPLSVAFFLLLSCVKVRIAKNILLFTLTTALCFIMIMSPTANLDNHIFSPNTGVRYAFTESEVTAASFFAKNSFGNISSDFDYCTNPSSSIFANYYDVSYERIISLDESLYEGKFEPDGTIKIIRREITERAFRLAKGLYRIDYDLSKLLRDSRFNKIYDSYEVSAYL